MVPSRFFEGESSADVQIASLCLSSETSFRRDGNAGDSYKNTQRHHGRSTIPISSRSTITMSVPFRPDTIPVLAKYGSSLADFPSSPADAKNVAVAWITEFRAALLSGSPEAVMSLFISDTPTWRDLFVLSWDIRSLIGTDAIHAFLSENLGKAGFTSFILSDIPAGAMPLGKTAGWLNVFASFETSERQGTAVIHLVPTRVQGDQTIIWKAHGILMDLDGLQGHPWLEGEHRRQEPILGGWEEDLAKECKFEDRNPTVIVIGGSQSGLVIAARLKVLGVPTLVLERDARLGDAWRNRYGESVFALT
jgi:hypothetical protein